jgi:hypothetical protein
MAVEVDEQQEGQSNLQVMIAWQDTRWTRVCIAIVYIVSGEGYVAYCLSEQAHKRSSTP